MGDKHEADLLLSVILRKIINFNAVFTDRFENERDT